MTNKTINTKEIEEKRMATIRTASDYTGMNVPLRYILYDLTDMLRDELKAVRDMPYHTPEQKQAKNNLPRYYVSGEYNFSKTGDRYNFPIKDKPIVASNLMIVELDEHDNDTTDIWAVRKDIFELPYVYCCLKSVSGHGYYCIIPIEDTQYTKQYYNYIADLWEQKYNVKADRNADTLVRARILSFDDERDEWIKKDTDIKIWRLKRIEKDDTRPEVKIERPQKYIREQKGDWEMITNKAMELLINDGYYAKSYNAWFHLGAELKNFDNGWDLFYKSSTNNTKYNDDFKTIKKKWDGITPSGITDDLIKKWCGMAKKQFGEKWFLPYLNSKS